MADKFGGRDNRELQRPPLRTYAESLGLPVEMWETARSDRWLESQRVASRHKVLVTASFGAMIPTSVIERFPRRNTLNVHPSLLPRLRGAAPIQWAIAHGDRESGVTVQELSMECFDRGDILAQHKVTLPSEGTYHECEGLLAREGGDLLMRCLADFREYKKNCTKQDGAPSSAPKISRRDAMISEWDRWPADRLFRADRAFGHQHKLFCTPRGHTLTFTTLCPVPEQVSVRPALGTIIYDAQSELALLGCADHTAVGLRRLRPASVRDVAGITAKLWWETHVVRQNLDPVYHLRD